MIIYKKLLAALFLATAISSIILINRTIELPILQKTKATQTQSHQQQQTITPAFKVFSALPPENDNNTMTTQGMVDAEIQENAALYTKALDLINSPQKDERVAAIQQLGAYPNQASETLLTQLLTTDQDPSVRNAAARSLGIIYKPKEPTLDALLNALEDASETVCITVLGTPENYLLRADDSEKGTDLKLALKNKSLSSDVSNTVKEAIKEILIVG